MIMENDHTEDDHEILARLTAKVSDDTALMIQGMEEASCHRGKEKTHNGSLSQDFLRLVKQGI
jgi:hypothetical protein